MSVSRAEVESEVRGVLDDMIEEWGEELDEPIGMETKLVEDVGFASIDFVQFAVAIEERFNAKLGFQQLLIQDGQYVQDLSVSSVLDFVEDRLNNPSKVNPDAPVEAPVPGEARLTQVDEAERVDAEKFAAFRGLIRPRSPRAADTTPKNPPVVFVLSPPRSGSTLMRVMLAGNPSLFAPPELHLLAYSDMAERHAALQNEHNNHLLEGTIRAMMQLKGLEGEAAREFAARCEAEAMPVKHFYKLLQEPLNGRLLVDKTPTYLLDKDILERAEMDFDNALYIHLQRHPLGTIRSYEESKLTRLMPLIQQSAFNTRQLAEMTWLHSHSNALAFAETIPDERWISVRYEDIVQQPDVAMRRLCAFLGIDFHPDMTNPYAEKEQRMTDGVDTASKMSGDIKFHLHQGIDPGAASRWEQFYSVDILGEPTRDMARQLGYDT